MVCIISITWQILRDIIGVIVNLHHIHCLQVAVKITIRDALLKYQTTVLIHYWVLTGLAITMTSKGDAPVHYKCHAVHLAAQLHHLYQRTQAILKNLAW